MSVVVVPTRPPAPSAGSCTGMTSVTSDVVTILAAPVERVIESNRLLVSYTNSSLCADVYLRLSLSRPVTIKCAPLNNWTVSMPLVVTVDGVTQLVRSDVPSWMLTAGSENTVGQGMLLWDEVFVVGPGKRLELYGATILHPNSGIHVSNFNEVSLGTGSIVVSE